MEPLILLSHGSRHPRAQGGIDALGTAVAAQLGAQLGAQVRVVDAHLDFSASTLAVVARQLAHAGSTRAVVVPLLFSSGYHARVDVPEEVAAASEHSGLALHLTPTLGAGDDVAEILASVARRDNPDARELIIHPVGSSRPEAIADYHSLASRVRSYSGIPVRWHPVTQAPHSLVEFDVAGGHVVPLFVTEGLLLDKARANLPAATTISGPLAEALAPIVAARYRQAVSS